MSFTSMSRSLWKKFTNKEYRHAYVESLLDSSLASQILQMREQRKLTQSQLADLAGMKQPQVSRLENVNYSGWSIKTLKRLARAFDVVLTVRFESFGDAIKRAEAYSPEGLRVPSFDQELATSPIDNALTQGGMDAVSSTIENRPSERSGTQLPETSHTTACASPLAGGRLTPRSGAIRLAYSSNDNQELPNAA